MNPRYVLRFRGKGQLPEESFRQISDLNGITVCERSDKMVFVEGSRPVLEAFTTANPDWNVFDECQYTIPEKRHSVREE